MNKETPINKRKADFLSSKVLSAFDSFPHLKGVGTNTDEMVKDLINLIKNEVRYETK